MIMIYYIMITFSINSTNHADHNHVYSAPQLRNVERVSHNNNDNNNNNIYHSQ